MVPLDFILVAKVCKVVEYAMHVGIVFCSPFLYKYIYKFSCLLSCVSLVLPYPYCSTCLSVLEYFHISTVTCPCVET